MSTKRPIPKTEFEKFDEVTEPYLSDRGPSPRDTNIRGRHTSAKGDTVKKFNIGLQDIDEAIDYYFTKVIKPTIKQGGDPIQVPVVYGSKERWVAVQKDGYYRDKNGKIQTPLIMFKRNSITKNREVGNKMDANYPRNFQIFEKKHSKENIYDRFGVLNNRVPVKELYGVIIPDYVNISYSCIIWTDKVYQMNKIIEAINFASDSYWGESERFKFKADIDSYNNQTELTQGEDRQVRTDFELKLMGYVVPDSVNAEINGLNKTYSTSAVNFNFEVVGDISEIDKKIKDKKLNIPGPIDIYDQEEDKPSLEDTMTTEEIAYVTLNNTAIADSISGTDTAVFENKTIAQAPQGFNLGQEAFYVYINNTYIPNFQRTVSQAGNNIEVVFDTSLIDYTLSSSDEVILVGKFN